MATAFAMGMSMHFNMEASGFTAYKIPGFDNQGRRA
jgi:hypothetical protein